MTLARVPVSVGAAIVLTLVTSAVTPVRAETETYALDPAASEVDFTIWASKLFTFKREGQFKEFTGQLSFDPENPLGTQVDLTVYTSSVDIHDNEHNELLKSGAFFDVELKGGDPLDMRCYLLLGKRTLTETWLYQYFPPVA